MNDEKIYYVIEITENSPFKSIIGKRYHRALRNGEDMTSIVINKLYPFEKLVAENLTFDEAERLCNDESD